MERLIAMKSVGCLLIAGRSSFVCGHDNKIGLGFFFFLLSFPCLSLSWLLRLWLASAWARCEVERPMAGSSRLIGRVSFASPSKQSRQKQQTTTRRLVVLGWLAGWLDG